MAERLPDAEVLENDISPIQPSWVPPKVFFEVDDFNGPWLQTPNSYDFIHECDCHAAVKDWGKLAENVFKTLKPGGQRESQEHTVEITTDDDSVPEDNILKQCCAAYFGPKDPVDKEIGAFNLINMVNAAEDFTTTA
ncbi:uncharacterized protein DFL_005605 [Arthrobotrys flagrans]|uniref:Uncharacterized protein n=1 Tax=Arthrobotrys flagrans TaxID=97331 RepID=A0A436ZXX2_ARTFL|nr:hypothetical protein DFL_005605 [Arthrobotrys flagrans]